MEPLTLTIRGAAVTLHPKADGSFEVHQGGKHTYTIAPGLDAANMPTWKATKKPINADYSFVKELGDALERSQE